MHSSSFKHDQDGRTKKTVETIKMMNLDALVISCRSCDHWKKVKSKEYCEHLGDYIVNLIPEFCGEGKPEFKQSTFPIKDYPVVRNWLEFQIRLNERELNAWKSGDLWFNNPDYPKEFKKRIKALKKVLSVLAELEELTKK